MKDPKDNGQNSGQSAKQPGEIPGSETPQGAGKKNDNSPVRTYSGKRDQDQQDPGIKSREDAENLLDSLKDD